MALAVVAKTPGPGLAARTSIATANPNAEYSVKTPPLAFVEWLIG